MAQASTVQVTLLPEDFEFLQSKVASGEYSSASEVIRGGLAALQDKDAGFEAWAREVGVPAFERYVADPSRGRTLDEVREALAARLAKGQASRA